jgi:hypothetical protein
VGPLQWPYERRVVSGLAENVSLALAAQSVQAQSNFDDAIFKKPGDDKE